MSKFHLLSLILTGRVSIWPLSSLSEKQQGILLCYGDEHIKLGWCLFLRAYSVDRENGKGSKHSSCSSGNGFNSRIGYGHPTAPNSKSEEALVALTVKNDTFALLYS